MEVLTLTTLLTVDASGAVPTSPKIAVSAEPGLPAPGSQLLSTFQLFAPGDATFHEKVVAPDSWIIAARAANVARLRDEQGVFMMLLRLGLVDQMITNCRQQSSSKLWSGQFSRCDSMS